MTLYSIGRGVSVVVLCGMMSGCLAALSHVAQGKPLPTKEQLKELAHPDQLMIGTQYRMTGAQGGDIRPDSVFMGIMWNLNLVKDKDDEKKKDADKDETKKDD